MSGFLTKADLEELTDYIQPAAQIRWLRRNGYYVEISRLGRPRVTWTQVEEMRRKKEQPELGQAGTPKEPNVVAFQDKLQQSQR